MGKPPPKPVKCVRKVRKTKNYEKQKNVSKMINHELSFCGIVVLHSFNITGVIIVHNHRAATSASTARRSRPSVSAPQS